MLYNFNVNQKLLVKLNSVSAKDIGITEDQIEKTLALNPEAIFRSTLRNGSPVLIIRKSQPGVRMADIIALDVYGRLVLVECKRGNADRNTLAQLLDYASSYDEKTIEKITHHWEKGEGKNSKLTLIEEFRNFADDQTIDTDELGKEHVLVVVAAGPDEGFSKISKYLEQRGIPVHLVQVNMYRNGDDLIIDVEPVELESALKDDSLSTDYRAWLVNTDETHSPGATERLLEKGLAAIWGYPDEAKILERGWAPGDVVFAYKNGAGIVAKGEVVDGKVSRADHENSVFPECTDGNEWHLKVDWTLPQKEGDAISNSEVRSSTGKGLPVRNTVARLWDKRVVDYLLNRWQQLMA